MLKIQSQVPQSIVNQQGEVEALIRTRRMAEDETINAALQYVKYAYKRGTGYAGTVQFKVVDKTKGATHIKSIQVKSGDDEGVVVYDGDPPAGIAIDCVVEVEKTILLALLTGALEAPTFMWGQIAKDNATILTNFVNSFEFKKEKFEEFQQVLSKQVSQETTAIENKEPGESEAKVENGQEGPNPPITSPKTRELKQNLALGGLKLISAVRTMAKEVDAFIDRVKDTEQVQKAVAQLGEETAKLQATESYQKIQASAAFNTLRFELEKASIGVSTMTAKAMDKGKDVVETLTKTAYPTYIPTQIDLSIPLPDNPPPLITSPPRSIWAVRASQSFTTPPNSSPVFSPSPSSPLSSSPSVSPSATRARSFSAAPLSTPPSLTPPASPSKPSLFQSFKSVVSSPSLPRIFTETKEEKEARERETKLAREKERQRQQEKEKEAKDAREKAAKEAKEKEERQREEKRKALQAKLGELQRHNEETERKRQEDARRKKEELEEKRRQKEAEQLLAQQQAQQTTEKEQEAQKELNDKSDNTEKGTSQNNENNENNENKQNNENEENNENKEKIENYENNEKSENSERIEDIENIEKVTAAENKPIPTQTLPGEQ